MDYETRYKIGEIIAEGVFMKDGKVCITSQALDRIEKLWPRNDIREITEADLKDLDYLREEYKLNYGYYPKFIEDVNFLNKRITGGNL